MQARGPSSRYCALWARLRSSRLPEVCGFQVRAPNPGSGEPIQTLLPDYFCGRGFTPTSGLCRTCAAFTLNWESEFAPGVHVPDGLLRELGFPGRTPPHTPTKEPLGAQSWAIDACGSHAWVPWDQYRVVTNRRAEGPVGEGVFVRWDPGGGLPLRLLGCPPDLLLAVPRGPGGIWQPSPVGSRSAPAASLPTCALQCCYSAEAAQRSPICIIFPLSGRAHVTGTAVPGVPFGDSANRLRDGLRSGDGN